MDILKQDPHMQLPMMGATEKDLLLLCTATIKAKVHQNSCRFIFVLRRESEKMSRYEKDMFIMLSVMAVIIIADIIIIM